MVNRKTITLICKESDNEESDMEEMRASMDDLRRQNRTLEDNVHHIQQPHQEVDMVEVFEALDP